MKCATRHFLLAVVVLASAILSAGNAVAQTVQLPTFHFFTLNTSVLVPDGGDAFLGGVDRASSGRIERGIPGLPGGRPFTNSAIGGSTAASGVSVSAQIHDLDAMDRAILGDNFVATSSARIPAVRTPRQLAAVQTGANPIGSVAALRTQVAAEDAAAEMEAAESLARGRQLLTEGKTSLAKTYLKVAARHSKAEARDQALALLRELERTKSAAKVAGK
jgi:hypothetical protein